MIDLISGIDRKPSRRYSAVFFAVIATVMISAGVTLIGGHNAVHADARIAQTSLVSENASLFTPAVLDGRVEAIEVEGDTVYVGGTFTQIQEQLDGEIINQSYLFAYSRSSGNIIRSSTSVVALHASARLMSNSLQRWTLQPVMFFRISIWILTALFQPHEHGDLPVSTISR